MTGKPTFNSPADLVSQVEAAPGPDVRARAGAAARNDQLTKPPGALGRLEDLAIWYAGWRGDDRPRIRHPQVIVFAGNHGVAARGVSAFPADVTAQMVANFESGGAAINQLAALADARLDVVPLWLDTPTADFTVDAAMSPARFTQALQAGWASVADDTDVLVVGEMGIGNTTSAAAVAALLLGGGGDAWVGRGTGVDDAGLAIKSAVVDQACARHEHVRDPLEVLRAVGGHELAAMAGAMAAARVRRVPVILDGFIATAAAAALATSAPSALHTMVAGHRSAESAHGRLLDHLGLAPLLDLGLRLGEGSGAALAIQVLKGALACHNGMARFDEAGVSAG